MNLEVRIYPRPELTREQQRRLHDIIVAFLECLRLFGVTNERIMFGFEDLAAGRFFVLKPEDANRRLTEHERDGIRRGDREMFVPSPCGWKITLSLSIPAGPTRRHLIAALGNCIPMELVDDMVFSEEQVEMPAVPAFGWAAGGELSHAQSHVAGTTCCVIPVIAK